MDLWVKLFVRYYGDKKIEALDDAAEVMFVRGLARAGELEQEGFIPEPSFAKLTRRRRYATLVSQLVASGLWTSVPGGVRVTNWDRWQGEFDELARRRATDRERQRKRRLRLKQGAESTVSRDSAGVSRDGHAHRGKREDKELGVGVDTNVPGGDPLGEPPPRKCPIHRDVLNPPNCVPCKEHRLAADEWERQRELAEAERRRRIASAPRCTKPGHGGQLAGKCGACAGEAKGGDK